MSLGNSTILCTNYRFEIDLYGPLYYARRQCLQERLDAERRQDERIAENERNSFTIKARDWALSTEAKVMHRFNMRGRRLVKKEASLENKSNVIVRRAALRRQLELDYRQYQHELREQGKAFYFQRI